MPRSPTLLALALVASTLTACRAANSTPHAGRSQKDSTVLAIDLARTRPTGLGPAFRPRASGNPAVAMAAPVGGMRCRAVTHGSYGAHVELFAADHGVQLPAGIGISGGQRRGASVVGARCRYPLSTMDPTGVVLVERQGALPTPTLGELFALWGQTLLRTRLASFPGRVVAFVNGRRWSDDPRAIPLRRHAQIVLEVGPFVEPHPSYLFPLGL